MCAYRACDRLRCTDCDFSVSSFDNVQWASNIDYLFLRNNMPDYERLKSKLRAKKGMFFFKLYLKKVPISFIYLQWQWTNFPQIWADITVCKWSNYWKTLAHFVQNCSLAAERFHFIGHHIWASSDKRNAQRFQASLLTDVLLVWTLRWRKGNCWTNSFHFSSVLCPYTYTSVYSIHDHTVYRYTAVCKMCLIFSVFVVIRFR